MICFETIIKQFANQGEKTGWTYIEISEEIANKLLPGNKKSFRVRGKLDDFKFKAMALIPMGNGNFIMALKADVRKQIKKRRGDKLKVEIELDEIPPALNAELLECLADEPAANLFFKNLLPSHQRYYNNWIESAKTLETKAKRITQCVVACSRKQHYGEMVRALKEEKDKLMG